MKPSAPGAQFGTRRENCGGPKDRIIFNAPQYDWVKFAMSAVRDRPDRVQLSFAIDKDISYKFTSEQRERSLSREISIASSASALKVTAKSGSIFLDLRLLDSTPTSSGYTAVVTDALMKPDGFVTLRKWNWIHQTWALPRDLASGFDLEVPRFIVDGIDFEIPKIHFEPSSGVFVSAVNC
jgi:hypothetical protein